MQWGLDTLGLAMYPDVIAREIPEGWWFSAFWEEFGPAKKAIKQVLATKRPAGFRGQGLWSSTHTYTKTHFEKAKLIAREHELIAREFPLQRIKFSPFCEHNLDNPDPWLDEIARIAPSCGIVNSVWKGKLSSRYENEVHGTAAKPRRGAYSYSFDGTGCVDINMPDFLSRHAQCQVFYFWTYQFNGKRNGATKDDQGKPLPYIPPTERKFWPTGELIDSLIYLRKPKGDCLLRKRDTHKSHSDQQNPTPRGKELKPVIIIPEKVDRLEYVAQNGQVIAVAPYFGTYRDGRHRYYMPNMGYQLALKAERIQSGNPVVRLRAGSKILGTVNPGHRQNEYR